MYQLHDLLQCLLWQVDLGNVKAIERHLCGEAGYFFYFIFFPVFILGIAFTTTYILYMYVYVYIYVCVYVKFVYICVCIYIYKSRFFYLPVVIRTLAVL